MIVVDKEDPSQCYCLYIVRIRPSFLLNPQIMDHLHEGGVREQESVEEEEEKEGKQEYDQGQALTGMANCIASE